MSDAIEKRPDAEVVPATHEQILALQERQLVLQEQQLQILARLTQAMEGLLAQAQQPRGRAGAEAAAMRDLGVHVRGGSIPLSDFAAETSEGF